MLVAVSFRCWEKNTFKKITLQVKDKLRFFYKWVFVNSAISQVIAIKHHYSLSNNFKFLKTDDMGGKVHAILSSHAVLPSSEIYYISRDFHNSKRNLVFKKGEEYTGAFNAIVAIANATVGGVQFPLEPISWTSHQILFCWLKRPQINTHSFALVYRTATTEPLTIEPFGYYANSSFFLSQQNTVVTQRRDLNGITLRVCLVMTNNDSLKHLTDYQ